MPVSALLKPEIVHEQDIMKELYQVKEGASARLQEVEDVVLGRVGAGRLDDDQQRPLRPFGVRHAQARRLLHLRPWPDIAEDISGTHIRIFKDFLIPCHRV